MSEKRDCRRVAYSNNRTINRKAISTLVERSGIKQGDTVYDIGAGTGVISRVLLSKGARVIGIEKDREVCRKFLEQLVTEDRFELYIDDFLQSDFRPEIPYKVFSNIPFNHTVEIISKLLFNVNPPEDCYLVIQKEAAGMYLGTGGETMKSLLVKPLYWVDIVYHFDRKDFFPVPSVDIVLVQFERRRCRLVPERYYPLYREFIEYCRKDNGFSVKKMLSGLFTWPQIRHLAGRLTIDLRAKPSDLIFMQYLGLFQFYLVYGRRGRLDCIGDRGADYLPLH